jgi:FkbM family methyltransferase
VQAVLAESLASGDVFFDIGANVGFFTLIAARLVSARGHVYAFEPNPAARAVLERSAMVNGFGDRVSVLPWALGNGSGRAKLMTKDVLTAHLAPDGDLPVEVRALDDLDVPTPDLVKIDVEGYEEMVLEGMTRVLTEGAPTLVVETHETPTQIPEMLAAAGYGVTWLKGAGMPHLLACPGRMAAATVE